jgi:S1-C subfamily serine protease
MVRSAFHHSAFLLVFLFLALGAQGEEKVRPPQFLKAGESLSGSLRIEVGRTDYNLYVPSEAFAVRFKLSEASADLDLILRRDEAVAASGKTADFDEEIFVSRLSDTPLRTGSYSLEVRYPFSHPPAGKGRPAELVTYRLSYELYIPSPEPLSAGTAKTLSLTRENGNYLCFYIDVPPGTRQLRFDLYDTTGDLDLWLRRGDISLSPAQADLRSETTLSRESILLKGRDFFVEPGRYFLSVFDPLPYNDRPEGFTVLAAFAADPPRFLLEIPEIPRPQDSLDRALRATVEIHSQAAGGSGCLVSPDGYILTNLHVVKRGGPDGPGGKPVVAVNMKNDLPPRELFQASIIRTDAARDLALLKIDAGLYGQPLPAGYRFPHLPLGDSAALSLGEPLTFIGYPSIGGTGSRVSVTLSRGVVSGFEHTRSGRLIKTDGEINEGNSGGAALNPRYELIGLPTQIVGIAGGQLGFITPVSIIPDEWLTLIRR